MTSHPRRGRDEGKPNPGNKPHAGPRMPPWAPAPPSGRAPHLIPFTPLRAPPRDILAYAEECHLVRTPDPRPDPSGADMSKYCKYHRCHGHNTNDCQAWRKEIERLIQAGMLGNFIDWDRMAKRDTRGRGATPQIPQTGKENDRDEPNRPFLQRGLVGLLKLLVTLTELPERLFRGGIILRSLLQTLLKPNGLHGGLQTGERRGRHHFSYPATYEVDVIRVIRAKWPGPGISVVAPREQRIMGIILDWWTPGGPRGAIDPCRTVESDNRGSCARRREKDTRLHTVQGMARRLQRNTQIWVEGEGKARSGSHGINAEAQPCFGGPEGQSSAPLLLTTRLGNSTLAARVLIERCEGPWDPGCVGWKMEAKYGKRMGA
nr:uncharacterized protein LOC109171091 [Ipomoea trifida]